MGKITEMTLAGPVDGSELIEVVQNGTSKKAPLSALSAAGKSAYKSATDAGFVGTEAAWVLSLKGAKGDAGVAGVKGNDGADGLSAYELAVAAGYIGNTAAWLASLKGAKGDTGAKGDPGDAGVAGAQGNTTLILGTKATEADLPVAAETIEGTSYIIGEDLFTQIQGAWVNVGQIKGDRGLSAYELAVANGEFVGSFEAWYESIKGVDGIGLRILGSFPAVPDLPTEGNLSGDSWIINEAMYVWDTTKWVKVGQVGPAGKSIYETAVAHGFVGTEVQYLASLVGKSAYQSAVTGGFVGTEAAWLATLVGKSAYGFAVSNGFVGDEATWLASLVGKTNYQIAQGQGFAGTEAEWLATLVGKTNYQIAKDQGFVGTAAEWLLTLVGPKGDKGEVGAQGEQGLPANAVKIVGKVATSAELPSTGNVVGDAYYVGKVLYVFSEADGWVDIGTLNGLSAYELALEEGFVGTVAQWLLSIRGESIFDVAVREGFVGDEAAFLLSLVGKDAYTVAKDGGFVGDVSAWLLSLKGGKGDTGDQGIQGIQGETGAAGKNLQILGKVATVGDLPASPAENDAYIVGTNLYLRVAGAWLDGGSFVGPKGDTGADGATGPKGADGADGAKGDKGDTGNGLVIKAVLADASELPTSGQTLGDAYLLTDGDLYIYTGAGFTNVGKLRGEKGDQGEQGVIGLTGLTGKGLSLKGAFLTSAELPVGAQEGDAYFVKGVMNIWTNGSWLELNDLTGPSAYDIAVLLGYDGSEQSWIDSLKGEQGLMGPGITILGKLASTADLPGSGQYGDGYLISGSFWGWTGTQYENLGNITGPKGDKGDAGTQGIQGVKGNKGDRGSLWLNDARDPNLVDGSVQDYWYNTTTQEYWVKTNSTTWVSLGHFGGGNVFSPSDDGKLYARKYSAWVEITVVEAPTDGKLYARKNGAWVEAVLPTVDVQEAPQDGKQYIRKNGAWIEVVIPAAGIAEAPNDTQTYVRQNGAWVAVTIPAAGIADANNDGKLYGRKNGAWVEVVIPAAGIADAPNDGKQYLRKSGTWVEPTPVTFDRYTTKLLTALTELDLSLAQVFTIANSAPRTLTFKAGTVPASDRSMTVVLVINGNSTITWPTISWNGGAAPVLGTATTIVTLMWDGTRWIGNSGATF